MTHGDPKPRMCQSMDQTMNLTRGFGVAWILAFTFLPIWLSALAALSWCAWVTPFILEINSRVPKWPAG